MPRESAAARKARAGRIVRALARAYPDAHCALHHRNPFELLIATILSAQCTDEKVNEVTPELFRHFPDARALAAAEPARVEGLIHPTGFYRQKTKSLIAASREIAERFANRVPSGLEELTALRGVARKTANVVRGTAFGEPALAIDTHMKRVHQRLELTASDEPDTIERDLMELIPRRQWTAHTFRAIQHGRVCCKARAPRCDDCPLRAECPFPERMQARRAPARRRSRAAAR
jgi:endonuclease-3